AMWRMVVPATSPVSVNACRAAARIDRRRASAGIRRRGVAAVAASATAASAIGGEAEVDAAGVGLGPAGGDDLGAGVEADALGAVHGAVAEDRVLPPAE